MSTTVVQVVDVVRQVVGVAVDQTQTVVSGEVVRWIDTTTAAALAAHEADTTGVHGIADTSDLVVDTDARLTDSRTPTSHASSHKVGGTDPLTAIGIGAFPNSGRALPAVMTSTPTVAIGSGGAASTISGAVNLPYTTPLVRFLGGHPAVRYSQAGYYQNATLPDSSGIQNPFAVEFMHDGQYVEWSAKDAGTSAYYRIMVDGQYVTAAPQAGRNAADGANYRVKISFASRAIRRIRIELAYMPFGGLDVGPNDTVWLPPAPRRRAMILSDSYGVGSGSAGYVDTFWQPMAQILGWDDPWPNAENSTGYLNPGGGGKETFGTRLAATVVPYSPDVLVVWGGMNDTTTVNAAYTTSALGAACTALYDAIATSLPNCLLYVVGVPQPSASVPAAQSAANAAIITAASAHSKVRGVVDPTGWITGTGKVGSTTGTGNADLYTASDGVHPSPAGHAYLASRIAAALIGLGV